MGTRLTYIDPNLEHEEEPSAPSVCEYVPGLRYMYINHIIYIKITVHYM